MASRETKSDVRKEILKWVIGTLIAGIVLVAAIALIVSPMVQRLVTKVEEQNALVTKQESTIATLNKQLADLEVTKKQLAERLEQWRKEIGALSDDRLLAILRDALKTLGGNPDLKAIMESITRAAAADWASFDAAPTWHFPCDARWSRTGRLATIHISIHLSSDPVHSDLAGLDFDLPPGVNPDLDVLGHRTDDAPGFNVGHGYMKRPDAQYLPVFVSLEPKSDGRSMRLRPALFDIADASRKLARGSTLDKHLLDVLADGTASAPIVIEFTATVPVRIGVPQ